MPEVGVKKNNRKTEIPGAKEKGFSGLFFIRLVVAQAQYREGPKKNLPQSFMPL